MRPIIGIIGDVSESKWSQSPRTYIHAVENSLGVPIILPFVDDGETIERFADLCDGFLYAGGVDIDPSRYGEEKTESCDDINTERDDIEFRIFEKIIKTEKPIMGICRGAQFLNVAFGGTLYQDMLKDGGIKLPHTHDEVTIVRGTPLHALIGDTKMHTNTYHHQAVKSLGKGLEAMAYAPDGIIEAFCFEGDRYIRAYQWHPEKIIEEKHSKMIFDEFINACADRGGSN